MMHSTHALLPTVCGLFCCEQSRTTNTQMECWWLYGARIRVAAARMGQIEMHSARARKRFKGRHHHLRAQHSAYASATTKSTTTARGNSIADCSLMADENQTKQNSGMAESVVSAFDGSHNLHCAWRGICGWCNMFFFFTSFLFHWPVSVH